MTKSDNSVDGIVKELHKNVPLTRQFFVESIKNKDMQGIDYKTYNQGDYLKSWIRKPTKDGKYK